MTYVRNKIIIEESYHLGRDAVQCGGVMHCLHLWGQKIGQATSKKQTSSRGWRQ
jgi:hypothetical protein